MKYWTEFSVGTKVNDNESPIKLDTVNADKSGSGILENKIKMV